jgi:uncharacterized membrane protein
LLQGLRLLQRIESRQTRRSIMATVQQSIEVKVPVHTAYNQLTQFEEYPRFMEDVESVRQLDDTHLHWTTKMANRPVEWDAEITEQEPDRCIAWHNTSGPTNAGKVEVQELGPDTAQVTFTLHSEPQQLPGSMSGYTEEELAQRLRQDLARLKDFIEAHGSETGGWRGEVHDADVTMRDRGARDHSGGATPRHGEGQQERQEQTRPEAPIQMRHLGEMPQDTTAEEHGGVPTSDAIGKAMSPATPGSTAAVNQMETGGQPEPQADTGRTAEDDAPASLGGHAPVGTVVGAAGGTDAAAGARLSGSKGGPGGASLRQTTDAAGVTGAPEGAVRGDASEAASAGAAGGTGLGSSASASDTRTGTGTTSGSGTALTGGGASGGRDAGVSSAKGGTP